MPFVRVYARCVNKTKQVVEILSLSGTSRIIFIVSLELNHIPKSRQGYSNGDLKPLTPTVATWVQL